VKKIFIYLRGIQDLKIETESAAKIDALESEQVGLIEVSLSPRSNAVGKTLRDIHFRSKYGMQVIAIWHEGRAIRTNLRDIELNFGDALLLMGKRENINLLKADPDFIILSQEADQVLNKKKAPYSGMIMLFFVLAVLFNWLPISIAALTSVVLMIITGCLKIEDAYKAIDWRAIFLIAGMMPLGIAIQKTGTAEIVSNLILSLHGSIGNWGIMVLLYILITAAGAVIPTSALVVIMAPVFISISQQLGVSPYTVMMVLAVSSAASFISPVSHPANVLVMGPGGYRFSDYTKVGLPLTIVVMIIGLIMISIVWPL
jgi:di/tricarboxylate transporter